MEEETDRDCYFKVNFGQWDDIHRPPHSHSVDGRLDGTAHPAMARHLHYLIEKLSVYMKDKGKTYKSLDAVNYVLNGHVQDLQYKT